MSNYREISARFENDLRAELERTRHEQEAIKKRYLARLRFNLLHGLLQCTGKQQFFFRRLYANGDLKRDLEEIIDSMGQGKLQIALQQVERTIEKKPLRKKETQDD